LRSRSLEKVILIDAEKCTGCRLCEMVCSVRNEGLNSPIKARVKVVKWDEKGVAIPVLCQQCDDAPCREVCPVGAIYRDERTGAQRIDYERCILCRICVSACPFGAMGYDASLNRVFKCELCGGEPMCVKFCDPQALVFVDSAVATEKRRRSAAERLSSLLKHIR